MKDVPGHGSSLITRGARVQFAIGIALISVLPLLTLWYLGRHLAANDGVFDIWAYFVLGLIVLTGVGGYSILQKYPVNIVRLRGYLENMIGGELPNEVELVKEEDDIEAVEHCLNLILQQLRERLAILQKEKKELQSQLYQVQKVESLGIMAAGAAHDFTNLLTGMLTNLSLAMRQLPDDDPNQEFLKKVEMYIRRSSELTDEMMVYAGKGKIEKRSLDLSKEVKSMSNLLKASAARKVLVTFDLEEELPKVSADASQFGQLLTNLVINASDAMEGQGGTVTVKTRKVMGEEVDFEGAFVHGPLPSGECICVEVSDDGRGIQSSDLGKIFDPFYTTKKDGRGLGLAVVLGIVSSHMGAVLVDGAEGGGARFRCLFPTENALMEA
jgi:signal transduction histidine kinase